MDNKKIKMYQAELGKNLTKALAVTNSWFTAISGLPIVPFTKDDLHGLYDYYRAILKTRLEKNDHFTEDQKEQKCHDIDTLMYSLELFDLSNMPSDSYYPPRQLGLQGKVALLLIMNVITSRLKQIFESHFN